MIDYIKRLFEYAMGKKVFYKVSRKAFKAILNTVINEETKSYVGEFIRDNNVLEKLTK